MGKRKVKEYSAEFKTKVVLEVLKESQTQMQGDLATSITSKYDDNSAVVGTNKVYAAIHQFGGNTGRNKKVEIPARPYLKLTDEDINQVLKVTKDYLI